MKESKLGIGFMADVLYIKGVICLEEYEDMQSVTDASQLEDIVEKMLRGEYNIHKRGEIRSSFRGKQPNS